ncbi:outer membrane protein assembly factor BamB [Undibacterium flavidum]|uniref:Outer membrane protein assembly factor BamB n=1 Tax=Undibacterium flavidum TaxID=2762297 RepID=A0ABR6YEK1_9BURK|nr:outer membrane protein assembly factor BamB [Undibacterium flavidum]MBC3874953.1 outer membrane protein assembly factor BamB [Undibacterium flavidum]
MKLTMFSRGLLVSFISVGLLSACSSLSWMNPFAKEDTKNAPAVLQNFTASMSVKNAWTINLGTAGDYFFSPAIVGSDVYAASADGTVVKINSLTGQVAWKSKAELPLTAGVGANAKAVAVAGEKGVLFVFDDQGKFRWKAQASSEILSAPAVAEGVVVVHSIDNRISAFDIETGALKWMVERPLPVLTLRMVTGITIKDQQAIISTPGGKLIDLALQNGGLRWEATVAEAKGATELERIVDMSGAPALVGNTTCAASYQGRVACFDVSNGALKWAKNISSEVGVAADERFAFAADNIGGVFAYDINGGATAWKNDKLTNRGLSTPTSFGRSVVIGDRFGFLHFLSREDGSFLARMPTDGSKIMSAPAVVGNSLIVQTKSGAVVAFATE